MIKPDKQPPRQWLANILAVVGTCAAVVGAVWITPLGAYIDSLASGPAQLQRLNDSITAQEKIHETSVIELRRLAAAQEAIAKSQADFSTRLNRIERMLNVALASRQLPTITPLEPTKEPIVAPIFTVRVNGGFGPTTPIR